MKLPFDKVYCLHLAESTDRYEIMQEEYKKIGIEEQVEIWWTCKRNISNYIGSLIPSLQTNYYKNIYSYNKDVFGNAFNCSFEHYTIIKQAYIRGFNSIFIMEDDIKFIDDIDRIQDIMNNLPSDYDMLKFGHRGDDLSNLNKTKDGYWTKDNFKEKGIGAFAYALSRRGMEKIINIMDNNFCIIDQKPMWKLRKNTYCLVEPIAYTNFQHESNIE